MFLLCIAFPSLASAADDYAIKLDRPGKVGDRCQITAKGTQKRSSISSANGQALPEKHESLAAELTAEVEVLAISPKGNAQKARLTRTQLTFRSDDGPAEVFPDGTEVMVELVDGKSQYLVGGSPASETARKALDLVYRLSRDEPSDDVVFGTDQRQRVGDHWQLNAKEAAASLSTFLGSRIAPRDVAGRCEFKEVVETESGPALRIEGDLAVRNLRIPLPEGFTIRKANMRAKLSGLLPVDAEKGAVQQGNTVAMEVEMEAEKAGVKIQLATKSVETREMRFSYR